MRRTSTVLERLALVVLLIGGAGMLLAMFLGTADVVGTQFFGSPVAGVLEITESTMVLIVFGALAYAQIRRAHIRVELLYTHTGPRLRAVMDVLADVAALAFFGLLVWQAVLEGVTSWNIRETADGIIQFPLYPARWILILGTALLIAQLALDLVRDLARVKSGEEAEIFSPTSTIPGMSGPLADDD